MYTSIIQIIKIDTYCYLILVSIVVSIPACHAGDRGSIPRRGDFFICSFPKKKFFSYFYAIFNKTKNNNISPLALSIAIHVKSQNVRNQAQ